MNRIMFNPNLNPYTKNNIQKRQVVFTSNLRNEYQRVLEQLRNYPDNKYLQQRAAELDRLIMEGND